MNDTISDSMRTYRKLADDLNNSDSTRALRRLADDLNNSDSTRALRRLADDLNNSDSTRALRRLADDLNNSDSTRALRRLADDLNNSDSTRALRRLLDGFNNSDSMRTYRKLADDLNNSDSKRALRRLLDGFNNSDSMRTYKRLADDLNKLKNVSFTGAELEDAINTISIEDTNLEETLPIVEKDIQKELSEAGNYRNLTPETKGNILAIILFLLSLLNDYYLSHVTSLQLEEVYQKIQKDLLSARDDRQEIRSIIKSAHLKHDPRVLSWLRVTTPDKLNMRNEPRIKSDIITTLDKGTLLEIIDKSNRSWLLVEIEVEGELKQGWVSRRYTDYFK